MEDWNERMYRFTCPNQHRLKAQSNPVGKAVACPECAKVFRVEEKLIRHSNAHVSGLPKLLGKSPARTSLSDTGAMQILDINELI